MQAENSGGIIKTHNDPTISQKLWFEDGNIVIQAENTLFKVHRGILCANSSIFADMFHLAQPLSEEKYDGCPLVRFHDSEEELTDLLKAIFCSTTFLLQEKPTLKQLIGYARLGTKYNIPHIRSFALKLLRQAYPMSTEEFATSKKNRPFRSDGTTRIFEVITLARQLNILDILPAASIFASRRRISEIASSQLNTEEKFTFLIGRDRLMTTRARAFKVLMNTSATCLNHMECSEERSRGLQLILESTANPFSFHLDVNFCDNCNVDFRQSLFQQLREIWAEVPEMFDLPKWEVLHSMKEVDEADVMQVL